MDRRSFIQLLPGLGLFAGLAAKLAPKIANPPTSNDCYGGFLVPAEMRAYFEQAGISEPEHWETPRKNGKSLILGEIQKAKLMTFYPRKIRYIQLGGI